MSGKPIKKDAFELDTLLKQCEDELMPNVEAEASVDSKPSRHISLSNFDSVLATSMATNTLLISPSKEELVKSQAQATREVTTSATRVHEPCLIRSPQKRSSSHSSRHQTQVDLRKLYENQDLEVFIAHDEMPQEQIDEMEQLVKNSSSDKKRILIHTQEKLDTIEEFLARQSEYITTPLSTSHISPQKTSSSPQKAASVPQISSSKKSPNSRSSPQKTASSPLKTTASCSYTINTKSPTKNIVFKKPSSPLPLRKKTVAQQASEPPPLPLKRSTGPLSSSEAGPAAPGQEKNPLLWKQRAFSSLQSQLKNIDPSQKPARRTEEKKASPQSKASQTKVKTSTLTRSKRGAAKKREKETEVHTMIIGVYSSSKCVCVFLYLLALSFSFSLSLSLHSLEYLYQLHQTLLSMSSSTLLDTVH